MKPKQVSTTGTNWNFLRTTILPNGTDRIVCLRSLYKNKYTIVLKKSLVLFAVGNSRLTTTASHIRVHNFMSMWLSISFNAFTVLLWILSHVFFISFLFFLFFFLFHFFCFHLMEFFFILFCIFGRFLVCFQTVAKSKWLYFALYINNVCQPFWYCRKGKKGIYMWKKNKQHTKKVYKEKGKEIHWERK